MLAHPAKNPHLTPKEISGGTLHDADINACHAMTTAT
jgi:hypothetical protein